MWRWVICAAALLLASCDDRFPDYRYKMTIYVATPDGEKAFSSVREVRPREVRTIQSSDGKRVDTSLEGQAVILELTGRGSPVFALLWSPGGGNSNFIAGAALKPVRDEGGSHDGYAAWMQHMVAVKGARELPRFQQSVAPVKEPQALWPTFVTFDDISDPNTVREVSPESIGVRRITIEITDERVTDGIETLLPWLDSYDEDDRRLGGSNSIAITNNDLEDNIGTGAFRQVAR